MIERVVNILRYPPLIDYFDRFSIFVNENYTNIVDFYSGKLVRLSKNTFDELNNLIEENNKISELIEINKNRLSSDVGFWEFLEAFEDLKIKLETIRNTPKWIRSSVDVEFSNFQVVDGFLKSNQNLEQFAIDLGSENPDSDWANVAVYNNLFEDDYTHEGEKSLKVRVQYLIGTTPVNSVDIMVGDNVLGKDLFREIIFEEEDLKALLPKDTLNQSAEIILSVSKGSIAEYHRLGVDKLQASGNMNSLQFPSLFRQLVEMFKQDDSFKEVELIDVDVDQDAYLMKMIIRSRSGLSMEKEFKVFD